MAFSIRKHGFHAFNCLLRTQALLLHTRLGFGARWMSADASDIDDDVPEVSCWINHSSGRPQLHLVSDGYDDLIHDLLPEARILEIDVRIGETSNAVRDGLIKCRR